METSTNKWMRGLMNASATAIILRAQVKALADFIKRSHPELADELTAELAAAAEFGRKDAEESLGISVKLSTSNPET